MSEFSAELRAQLREAFAAEAMTAARYTYFAQMAEIEGHIEIGQLFTQLAQSSACAAHGHLDFLQHLSDPLTDRAIGDTQLNLVASITGELRQAGESYPMLAELAHAEGVADLASWLETLIALKGAHVTRLDQTLAALSDEPTEVIS